MITEEQEVQLHALTEAFLEENAKLNLCAGFNIDIGITGI